MDTIKSLYNNLIIGLPFDKYKKHSDSTMNTLSQEDKVRELIEESLTKKHIDLIYIIIDKRPDILKENDFELLLKIRKKKIIYKIGFFFSIFPIFSFYVYNMSIKKVFYNKIFIFGNVFSFLLYFYLIEQVNKEKYNLIYLKYSDVISKEDLNKMSKC